MSFMETWLRNLRNDALVAVDGFKLLRGDGKEEYGKAAVGLEGARPRTTTHDHE